MDLTPPISISRNSTRKWEYWPCTASDRRVCVCVLMHKEGREREERKGGRERGLHLEGE